jgi:hypothetical protein
MNFWGSTYSEDTNIEKTISQAEQRRYIAKDSGRIKFVWKDA